jgi:hypothetical protein
MVLLQILYKNGRERSTVRLIISCYKHAINLLSVTLILNIHINFRAILNSPRVPSTFVRVFSPSHLVVVLFHIFSIEYAECEIKNTETDMQVRSRRVNPLFPVCIRSIPSTVPVHLLSSCNNISTRMISPFFQFSIMQFETMLFPNSSTCSQLKHSARLCSVSFSHGLRC